LNPQGTQAADALDLAERSAFGHALDEEEFGLVAEGEDGLCGQGADAGRGVVEEAVVKGQKMLGLKQGKGLALELEVVAQAGQCGEAQLSCFDPALLAVPEHFLDHWPKLRRPQPYKGKA
jgi:hypothetical protein